MKRILSMLLVLTLSLGCIFVLASCGGPNDDPAEAKKALEANGYTIEAFEQGEKAGEKLDAYLKAKDNNNNEIVINWYKNDEDADKALEEYETLGNYEVADKSGNMVWIGTEAAVEAAQ